MKKKGLITSLVWEMGAFTGYPVSKKKPNKFAFYKQVPFTNNLAERGIWPAKVKQKISNCSRTFTGAEIYARIEGFVSTSRKNNRNVFSELCTTFDGYNFLTV